ncbi:MAG: histidine phosphatase family protein [Solirubrobacterales bacterium]|nr:histidine phosphatase family protein [Solirubrobacterales bacterium]
MADLLLVRHAETEWSRTRRHTGRTDVPLTDGGRQAARRLRPRLEGRAGGLVLTSPLSRAAETAALAGLRAEAEDGLLEWDYGDYEGRTTSEIRAERPDWYLFRDGAPGGELPGDVGARADAVITRVLAVLDEGSEVVLVAHGHLLRVLAARWLEQDASFGGRLWLGTGSLSLLGFEREVRVVRSWNEERP